MEDKILMKKQNRKYPRLEIGIEIFEPNGMFLASTKNISSGGCFLNTMQDITKHSIITFQLPETFERFYSTWDLRWKNDDGVGTMFNLDDTNKSILSQWLFIKELEQCE